LATTKQSPGNLNLTTGYSNEAEEVPRLEVSEAFRTLGVYISPSGNQMQQIKILRRHTQQYYATVSTSTFTAEEAYLSYMTYLRPQITYPLPCSTLTQTQCRHIQAPALAAFLPKLHLNRHTPRAVIFAGPRYGGLSIPELYTDQGYGQLKLLIGHLKLRDETGDLI